MHAIHCSFHSGCSLQNQMLKSKTLKYFKDPCTQVERTPLQCVLSGGVLSLNASTCYPMWSCRVQELSCYCVNDFSVCTIQRCDLYVCRPTLYIGYLHVSVANVYCMVWYGEDSAHHLMLLARFRWPIACGGVLAVLNQQQTLRCQRIISVETATGR